MEIIDKYIYAIGKQLPRESRDEIKKELKSLILDEIESSYGNNPSPEDVERVIYEFGSPREVAARYKKEDVLISKEYTDIYLMLIKILIGAMSIAFSVVFVIDVFNNYENFRIVNKVLSLFANIFSSSLSAIGAATLVFIIITKYTKDKVLEFDKPWSIKDLDDIDIEEKEESKIEIAIGLFLSLVVLVMLNISPKFISHFEALFEKSGIKLGHYINIIEFRKVLVFITVVWSLEIIVLIIKLITRKTRFTDLSEMVIDVFNISLLIYMINNSSLYLNYRSLLGFRGMFIFVLVVSIIDIISNLFKFIKTHLVELD